LGGPAVNGAGGVAARERLPWLDGWRGMAILLVLLGHFAPGAPRGLGGVGVDCFFVLSGRLMAEILIVRRTDLPTFFVRRASRILPALAVFVLFLLPALLAAPAYESRGDTLLGAAGALSFFQNYIPREHIVGMFEHTWSLAVEEHSYLILAFVALLTLRSRRAAGAAALLFAAAAMLNGLRLGLLPAADGFEYWRTDVRAASVLLSFAAWLAVEPLRGSVRGRAVAWACPSFLALGLALEIAPGVPDWLRFTAGTASLVVAVATLDVAAVRFRGLFEMRWLTWLGLVSYSLYLWQQPFYVAVMSGMPLLVCLPIAFACAIWSHYRVERPARARINALFDARRAPRPTATAA
jgi:peptidoglycan/LPS O-acetylase OafA/YrhL